MMQLHSHIAHLERRREGRRALAKSHAAMMVMKMMMITMMIAAVANVGHDGNSKCFIVSM